ncbi:MAG: class I SAM-dependent methyltransferase [Desulfobacteraceae bacterium]|nr:MAG: class I SAM-dependent methyltransferase [Desulfobacteraceae bacterium]
MINPFGQNKAERFSRDIAPSNEEQAAEWQKANRSWWESNPMRYDFVDAPISAPEFSSEFYREVDRRFLRTVRVAFPWTKIPFDNFIDYGKLASQEVLEVGVGCGTHAQLLAGKARAYTGIDITDYAVRSTTRRLETAGLKGRIIKMDAENMTFPDASFDFVWSWGVIHHSSNTKAILGQIHRVLKPAGKFVFMVYHESPWNTFFRGWLYYGLLKGGLFKGSNAHELLQQNTDGALARYYTASRLRAELAGLFELNRIDYLGNKLQLLPLKYGPLKEAASKVIPDRLGRWLTNRPFVAYMLVATCRKRSS